MRSASPRVRGEGWGEGAFALCSKAPPRPLTRIAELVIGPATSDRTRWQSDLSPRSGERRGQP